MNHAVVYNYQGCEIGRQCQVQLALNGFQVTNVVIGRDMIKEDFDSIFPNNTSVPLVAVNGQKIGGLTQLIEWLSNRPQLLTE